MLTTVVLASFKAHAQTDFQLARFSVLVGENGAGKTSALDAIRLGAGLSTGLNTQALQMLIRSGAKHMTVGYMFYDHPDSYYINLETSMLDSGTIVWGVNGKDKIGQFGIPIFNGSTLTTTNEPTAEIIGRATGLFGHVAFHRFSSRQIALGKTTNQSDFSIGEDGGQTTNALFAMRTRAEHLFLNIEDSMRRIVPSFNRVRFEKDSTKNDHEDLDQYSMRFDFRGAKGIPAQHVSQGTLIVLSILAAMHSVVRPRILLLDDFDHSLHPQAQTELVRLLKELLQDRTFGDTQIVATTHSPYVLDEFHPSEVVAFALRPDGTATAKRLSEHPDFQKTRGSLRSGELWTSISERSWVL